MAALDDTRYCPMCEDSGKKILELEQRVEAAEARIKASQEQEPVAIVKSGVIEWLWCKQFDHGQLYAQPPILPELAELQRENSSLAALYQQEVAKRAEAQHRCGVYAEQLEELRKLLESKVPEAQVKLCASCGFHQNCPTRDDDGGLCDDYVAQPKEPKQ